MFPFMAAATLASAGMGLAGNLLGRGGSSGPTTDWNYANWQASRDDNYLQRRVADGAKAGLSPLAAIGATGVGGIPQPMTGGGSTPEMNWSETGSHIGNALQQLLESPEAARAAATKRRMDDLAERQAEADLELTRARSRSIIDEASHPIRGIGGRGNGVVVADGDLSAGKSQATPVQVLGKKILINRNSSDAQDWENRYGQVGEAVGGALNMATDAVKTLKDYDRDLTKRSRAWFRGTAQSAYDWFKRHYKPWDENLSR